MTCTLHVALTVLFVSRSVPETVITAVPAPMAVTVPLLSTVATSGFDEVHVSSDKLPSSVTLSVVLSPTYNERELLSKVIPEKS